MPIALLLAAAAPTFDPLTFFDGRTRSDGRLKIVLRTTVPVMVEGTGRREPDGTLVLDQVVREGAKPSRTRQWRLRRVAPGRYRGTLTDARDPVLGEVEGPRLHLRFTTTSGFKIEQWLTLATDGRSADNLLRARRLGVAMATLHERIDKVD